jgi:hypothetical protein
VAFEDAEEDGDEEMVLAHVDPLLREQLIKILIVNPHHLALPGDLGQRLLELFAEMIAEEFSEWKAMFAHDGVYGEP